MAINGSVRRIQSNRETIDEEEQEKLPEEGEEEIANINYLFLS